MNRGLLLMVASLLLCDVAFAVDVCRFAKIEEDLFASDGALVVKGAYREIRQDDSGSVLSMVLGVAGVTGETLRPGVPVTWLLEDGTRVELRSNSAGKPTTRATVTEYSASLSTSWEVRFPLNDEAVHALARSYPTAIKYELLGKETTYEYSRARGRVLQRDFACFANLMTAEPNDASE